MCCGICLLGLCCCQSKVAAFLAGPFAEELAALLMLPLISVCQCFLRALRGSFLSWPAQLRGGEVPSTAPIPPMGVLATFLMWDRSRVGSVWGLLGKSLPVLQICAAVTDTDGSCFRL